MRAYVVDTNVPVVANGKSTQADPDCVMACVGKLKTVRNRGVVVLDDGMAILREYMANLNMAGQPGPGDAFMKWVFSVQADSRRCERVPLSERSDQPEQYEAFPDASELSDFDPSDRKFVAVALASTKQPEVLNAVDSDWANHYTALTANGLSVVFLCPQHVYPTE